MTDAKSKPTESARRARGEQEATEARLAKRIDETVIPLLESMGEYLSKKGLKAEAKRERPSQLDFYIGRDHLTIYARLESVTYDIYWNIRGRSERGSEDVAEDALTSQFFQDHLLEFVDASIKAWES